MKKVFVVIVLMLVGIVFNSCADPISEIIDDEQAFNRKDVGPTPEEDTADLDSAGF